MEKYAAPIFGAVLLFFAVPRFAAGVISIFGDSIVLRIESGKPAEKAGLDVLWSSREYAGRIVESGGNWNEMALAGITMGYKAGWGSAEGPQILEKTRAAQMKGLSLRPANTFAWMRLSYTAAVSSPPDRALAAAALAMSYKTGPFVSGAAAYRLGLCAGLWDLLDPDIRRNAHREARFLWETNPNALTNMAAKNAILMDIAQRAARNIGK